MPHACTVGPQHAQGTIVCKRLNDHAKLLSAFVAGMAKLATLSQDISWFTLECIKSNVLYQ